MSLPTVTQHLETLMESGLIRQDGFMASSIGRRAAAYVPCPSARAAVGAEILPHQLTIAAAGLDGEILGSVSCPLDFHPGDSYFESLAQAILGLLSRLSVPAEHVLGAGIGLQGLVSPDGQEVIYGRISNCTGMKANPLQKRLPFPAVSATTPNAPPPWNCGSGLPVPTPSTCLSACIWAVPFS